MLTKRIIPCLDVRNGRVVKGVRFEDLGDVGDPVELATRYEADGADEIVFLDITATLESRGTLLGLVRRTAERLFIPLTVGGGVRSAEDVRTLLRHGADKVALNTAAVERPTVLAEAAREFGSQCVVVAIDAKKVGPRWEVFTRAGRQATGLDLLDWSARAADAGAGEILLTSIDADGTQKGYDLPMLSAVLGRVAIPVIASGGCGSVEDIVAVFQRTPVDAALAASIFHFGRATPDSVKARLAKAGIPVRDAVAAPHGEGPRR